MILYTIPDDGRSVSSCCLGRGNSEFVHELKQYSIADDEVMVSFDVKSLFTSIPVDLALTITKERLQQDQNLAERTNMSVTNVMKLLDFVLTNNYFKHDGHHYKQIFGCAMGSPISPVLADLVMEVIEERAITTALHPPKWWFQVIVLSKDRFYSSRLLAFSFTHGGDVSRAKE